MSRGTSTRTRLTWRYTAIGMAVVVAVAVVFLTLRTRDRQYSPGEDVEGVTSELERGLPPGHPRVVFVNVAKEAGIDFRHFPSRRSSQLPEDMGSGAAWGDYDGDGDDDLFVANITAPLTALPEQVAASPASNRLYRNNGDGTFTDVTLPAGVGHKGIGMGAGWADYDGDGDLDLAVTTYPRILLYRNRGNQTFEEISRAAGLERLERFWAGASWGDYDNDGDLDLYVCAYVDYRPRADLAGKTTRQYASDVPYTLNPSSFPPAPNALFRNNGNGTFTDVTQAAGVANPAGRSLSAAWCDYDLDGSLDLYVANDVSDNAMFRNLGNGRFEDVSYTAAVADYRGAMGLAVGDYDRDGDFDIFITHWLAQENALYWNMIHSATGGPGKGTMRFMDIADMLGLGQIALNVVGWGTSFLDYDNDGQPDLFAVNGSTLQEEDDPSRLVPMKNFLFWQKNPSDGFFDLARASGTALNEAHVGRGAAFADYDKDGDVDIFVVNHSESAMLLRNDGGNKQNWIRVRARASRSNRDAIGAIVEVGAGGEKQMQSIGSQPSYLSQNSAAVHFGLGASGTLDRLAVRFPSGVVREVAGVKANQEVTVTE